VDGALAEPVGAIAMLSLMAELLFRAGSSQKPDL